MTDLPVLAGIAAAALAMVIVVTAAGLSAWRQWLALKRFGLERGGGDRPADRPVPAALRIELADLRERVRKLEAIAAGVDL